MKHQDTSPWDSAAEAATTEPMPYEAAGFADRVMTAIAVVPFPTPTRTFVAALRAGAAHDAVAALSVAWHIGTVRSWDIAPPVRTRSLALLLGVVTLLGMGSLAAAAAVVHVVSPNWIERAQTAAPVAPAVDEQVPAINLHTRGSEDAQTDHAAEGPVNVDPPDRFDDSGGGSADDGSNVDDSHDSDPPDKIDAGDDGDPPDKIDAGHDGSRGAGDPPAKTDDGHDGDRPARTDDGHDSDPPDKVDDGHASDSGDSDDSGDSGGSGG